MESHLYVNAPLAIILILVQHDLPSTAHSSKESLEFLVDLAYHVTHRLIPALPKLHYPTI